MDVQDTNPNCLSAFHVLIVPVSRGFFFLGELLLLRLRLRLRLLLLRDDARPMLTAAVGERDRHEARAQPRGP